MPLPSFSWPELEPALPCCVEAGQRDLADSHVFHISLVETPEGEEKMEGSREPSAVAGLCGLLGLMRERETQVLWFMVRARHIFWLSLAPWSHTSLLVAQTSRLTAGLATLPMLEARLRRETRLPGCSGLSEEKFLTSL